MKKNSATVQIKQIAEQVGMSPSTVSIVLNGRGDEMRIAKETQRRIQEAARELDYHPNIYARRLRCASGRQPNQIIAIFWNDTFMESSMASFFKGAAAAVEKNGYQVEFVIRLFQERQALGASGCHEHPQIQRNYHSRPLRGRHCVYRRGAV